MRGMPSKNICWQLINAQKNGKKIKHRKVPAVLATSKHKKYFETWNLIQSLDELCHKKVFNAVHAVHQLQALLRLFQESEVTFKTKTSLRNTRNFSRLSLAHMIYIYGGVEVILRLLFHPNVFDVKSGMLSPIRQKVRLFAIEIIHELCTWIKDVTYTIGLYDHLIMYLFTMMKDAKTYVAASGLLEELLAVNRKIIDLTTINNIQTLIKDLDETQFSGFCRLLSTTIVDIDFSEEKVTLISQDEEEKARSREKIVAQLNQELLLENPDFIERMIKVASKPLRSLPHSSRALVASLFPNSIIGASGTSSEVRDSSISDDGNQSSEVSNESMIQGTHLFFRELMEKVELLYVITLFLCGNYKSKVQGILSESKLLPSLNNMFESLGCNSEKIRFPRHNHNDSEDCDCAPENILKIQYLRFVHSFCDHNEKRYILLSVSEADEMRKIFDSCNLKRPDILHKTKSKYLCQGSKGLLSKIIDTLKITAANNPLRFWLCRAIEGFLRGIVSPPDQLFLINRGLVKHLFEHVIDEESKAKDILQSSFDLLGEVMKFNAKGFQQFNEAVQSKSQFEKFLSVMTSNIVDSNMFIRCIVLSYHKLLPLGEYDTSTCCLCGLIRKWEQKIYLIFKLITAISVDSLTQENVSCLNTILVFFIFAHKNGNLEKYLHAFMMEEQAHQHTGLILNNLYDLLVFWRVRYLERVKDCSQLGQSSCISFDKWKNVVDILLDNRKEKTSILYYLKPKNSNLHLCTIRPASRDV